MFSRFAITKKLKIISKELIIKSDINLFDLKIEQKDVLKIEHIGSFENIESDNYFLHSLIFDFSTYKDYKIRKNSDLFKNDKQKFLLNRDLLLYKFNQNKEQARHIHYLMVVYSNYKNEEFYNPNYEDNMRYFLELEKFY
ncbi:hypothetical protein NPA08_03850 [Mycoplasmopsis citelli]|nr:hypothetical protein [Mycoplasmopsis citelli]UUD36060.1 hypothetical protein NPA08_03850 [Mycoplasmopsis citelli]